MTTIDVSPSLCTFAAAPATDAADAAGPADAVGRADAAAGAARRRLLAAASGIWVLACTALLAGCAGSSPPVHWYSLRADPPLPSTPAAASAPAATPARPGAPDAPVWEVVSVRLPGETDRDTIVVAAGAASLQPLVGHRWAEPLRDSVPRVLAHDLALLRGADRVWRAPAPPGAAVARRLRVDVLTFAADADRRALRLQAQWWLSAVAPADGAPPAVESADIEVPVADPASVDALAAAHRLALWRLAERIAAAR